VNHLRHLIEAFFGDGSRFGLQISYSVEDTPLGTAGPIAPVLDKLGEEFVLTNGDLLTTLDIQSMIRTHRSRGAAATIGAYARDLKSEFGVLEVDAQMQMVGYREKPVSRQLISMGIYVLRAEAVRDHLVAGEHLDMPELVQLMRNAGKSVFCYQEPCFWLDVGRPADFAQAQEMFEKDPQVFLKQRNLCEH
jgi:NDP-sugar pyrophosphorylase family protein